MDTNNAKELLDILIENSLRILRAGFGVNAAESAFFDSIDLIRANPFLKAYFLEKVRLTFASSDPGRLDVGTVPRELIELAAHELQWYEFRHYADERIQKVFGGRLASAAGDIAAGVIDAYAQNWSDREFYKRYSKKQSRFE